MKKKINDLLLKMQIGENCIGETANKLLELHNSNRNTPKKHTGWYMLLITAISGILGAGVWYYFGANAGIFFLLILSIMILASIRYNQ